MTKARILADYVAGGTTAAEFDYMDGVTSNVQTQLTAKAPLASPAFTGTPTGITAAHLEAGVLPSDVTGGSGLTALGTVATGTIGSTVAFPAGHLLKVQNFVAFGSNVSSTSNAFTGNAVGTATYTPNGGSNNLSYIFAILSLNIEVTSAVLNGRIILETSASGNDITNVEYTVGDWGGILTTQGRSYGGLIHTTKSVQLDGTGHADIEWQFSVRNEDNSSSSGFTAYGATSAITVFEYQG